MRLHLRLSVACATIIASLFAPMAVAVPVDFFTTPITGGTTQKLANLSGSSPWTLPSGNTVSSPGSYSNSTGLNFLDNKPVNVTFGNLGGVNEIGFDFISHNPSSGIYISGITFDNGETWTGGTSYLIAQYPSQPSNPYYPFAGFHTTNTFTSATLTLNSSVILSNSIVDFTIATAVPEPSTIVSGVIAASVLAAAAHRNYRRRKSAIA